MVLVDLFQNLIFDAQRLRRVVDLPSKPQGHIEYFLCDTADMGESKELEFVPGYKCIKLVTCFVFGWPRKTAPWNVPKIAMISREDIPS